MKYKDKETRKQNRLEKLGTNHPVCVICGENDWRCIEQHHIAGQHFTGDLSNVCRNCHRKLSDQQKDHTPMQYQTVTEPERMGHFLIGLADLFELLVERLREFGKLLIESTKTEGNKR
jgi:hypothetical protein